MKLRCLLYATLLNAATLPAFAQCDPGEVHVVLGVHSVDIWAEETYFELVPAGNGCGNGTWLSGSSIEVGCAGTPPGGENGMPDNTSLYPAVCLPVNTIADLIFVDSYGDGGLAFDVYENGYLTHQYWGEGFGNTWEFTVTGAVPAIPYDSPCGAVEVIPDGAPVSLTNAGCTAAYREVHPPAVSCTLPGSWCEAGTVHTAWLRFEAEEGQSYRFTTCAGNSPLDSKIAVWSGSCGEPWNFSLVAANDDMAQGCASANGYSSECHATCLPAGTYFIQVDGYASAADDFTLQVATHEGEAELVAQVNDVRCPPADGESPDASIFPALQGAGADFSCQWTGPGDFVSDALFLTGLVPGDYHLVLTSSCSGVFEATYTIHEPEPWNVFMAVEGSTCPASEDGIISVNASGGTPDYIFTYLGPGGFEAEGGPVLEGCIPGNYFVTVTDANGCTYSQPLHVPALDQLEIDLGGDTLVCLGEMLVIEGPPGLEYLWQDGSTASSFTLDTEGMEPTTTAIILTGSTPDGCTDTAVLVVEVESCTNLESANDANASFLRLYPNPASGMAILELPSEVLPQEMRVQNTAGQEVFRSTIIREQTVLDLSALAEGMYMLRCGSGHLRILVQR